MTSIADAKQGLETVTSADSNMSFMTDAEQGLENVSDFGTVDRSANRSGEQYQKSSELNIGELRESMKSLRPSDEQTVGKSVTQYVKQAAHRNDVLQHIGKQGGRDKRGAVVSVLFVKNLMQNRATGTKGHEARPFPRGNIYKRYSNATDEIVEIHRMKDNQAKNESELLKYMNSIHDQLRCRASDIAVKQAAFRAEVKRFNQKLLDDIKQGDRVLAWARSQILALRLLSSKIKQMKELELVYRQYASVLRQMIQMYEPYKEFMLKCTVEFAMSKPIDLIMRHESLNTVYQENLAEYNWKVSMADFVRGGIRELRVLQEQRQLQASDAKLQMESRITELRKQNKQDDEDFEKMLNLATETEVKKFRTLMGIRNLYQRVYHSNSKYSIKYAETEEPVEQLAFIRKCSIRLHETCAYLTEQRRLQFSANPSRTKVGLDDKCKASMKNIIRKHKIPSSKGAKAIQHHSNKGHWSVICTPRKLRSKIEQSKLPIIRHGESYLAYGHGLMMPSNCRKNVSDCNMLARKVGRNPEEMRKKLSTIHDMDINHSNTGIFPQRPNFDAIPFHLTPNRQKICPKHCKLCRKYARNMVKYSKLYARYTKRLQKLQMKTSGYC